jgi:hypothetical protein
MAKKKFSNKQIVVFKANVSDPYRVGRVVMSKPVGKTFIYDVLCENGITYTELTVDQPNLSGIDSYRTNLFYQKYNMHDSIPGWLDIDESDDVESITAIDLEISEESNTDLNKISELDYEDDEFDPNY